ncbi:metallophosphoesterase family protein [Helcobacillus massiliensis]|uniref:3',5'-cyclic AMP phosphodiesterase CpdA n=1 Tax=Helcobacillus massiliensis TaxID=521392 RepID=A0A839QYP9_9MICO|nr:metallophosphoesterase [Helcobacillus massiliensis]MBB3023081.1 3',5'-cyclic AMP phosphodiesterase CpdA [Helcobacillus massiliensis]
MRILHLTDTHISAADPSGGPVLHQGRIDARAALDGVLTRLADIGPLDAVVHSGDASDDGSEDSYRHLERVIGDFARAHGAEHTIAMGNHDVPAGWNAATGLPTVRCQRVGDGRIITLDTSVPRAGYGHVGAEQREEVAAILAESVDGPTIAVLHHPPFPVTSRLFQALSLDGLDELRELLESRVDLILSGHLHAATSGRLGSVPVHVAPGIVNVTDPSAALAGEAGEKEVALGLSGASLVDVGADGCRIQSFHWPNAGDTGEVTEPVYSFDADTITRIVEAAGRK